MDEIGDKLKEDEDVRGENKHEALEDDKATPDRVVVDEIGLGEWITVVCSFEHQEFRENHDKLVF